MGQPKWRDESYKQKMKEWASSKLDGDVTFEEVKNTDMSIVLKATSDMGTVYLKTVNDAASFEALLTGFIANEFPEKTVDVIGVEKEQNWMLMHELSGESLRENKALKAYTTFIRSYAEFQQQTVPMVGKLLSLGVIDRRLPVLKQEIDEHLEALCETGLNEEETAEILALKPELLAACDEMMNVLPDTLDHGDLHSGNAFVEDEMYRFFDWGDASVTHPFLSVRVFWNSLFELLEEDTDENWMKKIAEFRPIYLEMWKDFAPANVLERQLYLAEQVGCIYRALSWHLYITPHREEKEASFNKPSQWLQLLMDHRKYV